MKRVINYSIGLVAGVTLALAAGCTSASRVTASSDLYGVHNRIEIAQREAAEAEAARQEAIARQARYEAMLAEREAALAEEAYYGSSEDPADLPAYDSEYERKFTMFDSWDYYSRPAGSYSYVWADPYTNIMVVDPRYNYSLWGYWSPYNSWSSSWYWGWNRPWYSSWYGGYYDPWYSWGGSWGWHSPYH